MKRCNRCTHRKEKLITPELSESYCNLSKNEFSSGEDCSSFKKDKSQLIFIIAFVIIILTSFLIDKLT